MSNARGFELRTGPIGPRPRAHQEPRAPRGSRDNSNKKLRHEANTRAAHVQQQQQQPNKQEPKHAPAVSRPAPTPRKCTNSISNPTRKSSRTRTSTCGPARRPPSRGSRPRRACAHTATHRLEARAHAAQVHTQHQQLNKQEQQNAHLDLRPSAAPAASRSTPVPRMCTSSINSPTSKSRSTRPSSRDPRPRRVSAQAAINN